MIKYSFHIENFVSLSPRYKSKLRAIYTKPNNAECSRIDRHIYTQYLLLTHFHPKVNNTSTFTSKGEYYYQLRVNSLVPDYHMWPRMSNSIMSKPTMSNTCTHWLRMSNALMMIKYQLTGSIQIDRFILIPKAQRRGRRTSICYTLFMHVLNCHRKKGALSN